jgi:hypothetical protein
VPVNVTGLPQASIRKCDPWHRCLSADGTKR